MKNKKIEISEAIILCGGLGTRLRSLVYQEPKPLAPLGNKVFLDLLVESLIIQDIQKIIFSVGYLKEKIINRYRGLKEVEVYFSEEKEPLGTGGAVKNAMQYVEENLFIAINGDSYIDISYNEIINKILTEKGQSLIVINKNLDKRKDVNLLVVENNKILKMESSVSLKKQDANCYVNCGVYILEKNSFEEEEKNKFSLENYFLPKLIDKVNIIPYISSSSLFDIGTPERYLKFLELNK